ncbi:Threonylcarbamoyl-AMP synthase [Madurella mycetomatis]|uniref:Threonylcarbamoyl-AMP synthase n=1 Tax=Madurella mycetomatis TaxID=100816 RepID=A0A175W590_9PEZI|nr:Threonylcarbamoyl-AMP synthase [Madurella mycetomatis]
MKTRILKVPLTGTNEAALGRWATLPDGTHDLSKWEVPPPSSSSSSEDGTPILNPLREAAHLLRTTSTPVAFPTETVYGLGADATRSDAVRGIYTAKGRPSDNPLIVHISDLDMLRRLLRPSHPSPKTNGKAKEKEDDDADADDDPIPAIYRPLISRFWPGPLTILLPLPARSPSRPPPLAAEVSAGQPTFGARLPASALARTLISLAGAPLAAPSANASTRPSPTCARHVRDDLDGRIELVLDGGRCAVGVESTVVDGLCDPPAVLRPGGVGIEELRACPGWERVEKAYGDRDGFVNGAAAVGKAQASSPPRAPGMKYKHYSPRARVVLFEVGVGMGTGRWPVAGGMRHSGLQEIAQGEVVNGQGEVGFVVKEGSLLGAGGTERVARLLDVDLGRDIKGVAHGLFAALRELDRLRADVILVEGVGDRDDIAAAVMNRLRKAASEIRA